MDNGQKTPRGHPDVDSYVKILRVFIDNGQTNRRTDKRTEKLIWCGLGNLIGSSRLFAMRGLEELFSSCAVVSVFVLAGNRFWFYILLMILEYHTVVVLC
jgi:hypothetical protein